MAVREFESEWTAKPSGFGLGSATFHLDAGRQADSCAGRGEGKVSLATEFRLWLYAPVDINSDLNDDEFIKEFLDLGRPLVEAICREPDIEMLELTEQSNSVSADHDVFVMMRRIQIIERGIKAGKVKLLFDEMERHQLAGHLYQPSQREDALDFFEIWLSTLMAKDKAMLNGLGVLKLEKKGDLRTAKLIEDETELMFRVLRFEMTRTHRGTIQFVQQEAAKMDASFFLRLSRILKKPGIEFKHTFSKLQQLLLIHWATAYKNREGKIMPPLCCYSDPALAEYVRIILKTTPISPSQIRKTWERLGLRKAHKIEIWEFKKERGKTIFS
jgi:hypothetical protein